MSSSVKAPVDITGKPTNNRFKNMFEEELIVTDKAKMRKELVDNRDKMVEVVKAMTPMDVFILFDEDDSGLISFSEFRKMLPFLGINISTAKAFRYFRMCDTDGSGEIDFDEFQVAIFACDPTSGNAAGYRPSTNLTPLDAFELFDEDQSGFLDEDEYQLAVEYLGIKASDETLEDWFFRMDFNLIGKIDFEEFRHIFLNCCDLRKELEDRGVDVPTLIRDKTLQTILKDLLLEEERRERQALAEARRHKQWVMNCREIKKIIQRAEFRAFRELRSALDAAGHVYVIGCGAYNQFDQPVLEKLETKKFKFEHFDKIVEAWRDRVQPEQLVDRLRALRRAQEQEEKRDEGRDLQGWSIVAKDIISRCKVEIDPFVEAQHSPFAGLRVSVNTASLWGRRIHQTACSENVIFALADSGEVFTWGGNAYWWHEIQPDSIYQTKWRGDTTPRSQLLMSTMNKSLPQDTSTQSDLDAMTPEERKAETIKTIAKYYNVWEPPPNPAQRMLFLEKDILPRIEFDDVTFSIGIRGKVVKDMNKWQLVEELFGDIQLEKKLLGERAHKAIREIEVQVKALHRRKKMKLAVKVSKRVEEMWKPLREVQAEQRANELEKEMLKQHEIEVKAAQNYSQWRVRVAEKREQLDAEWTPRGNGFEIDLIGATPRGPAIATPRGYESALQIAAGNAHACLVHKSGQLYTWGIGISGRLGLDTTEKGEPQADTAKPKLVQSLVNKPVVRVACGFSHTGVIVAGGDLYMWGSTATGKCGLGPITASEECFCSIPTRVLVGREDRKVVKLSCGAAHSGVVTEGGQLYVYGCGDGGRLGLGKNCEARLVPTLVETLLHEKIASVSCGNSTTLVCTQIEKQWIGDMDDKLRRFVGGKLYAAGSGNVLGRQCDTFTYIPLKAASSVGLIEEGRSSSGLDIDEDMCVKQVAAGYTHSAVVTSEGELLCWGRNRSGCCGAPMVKRFVDVPTPVSFLYTKSRNIALGKKAYQSSVFSCREARNAVNGRKEGNGLNRITCTQQESQPWIEIDLGSIAVIDKIVLWNRTDIPSDKNLARDMYTSRLFPCWVMVGRTPFEPEANASSLKESLRTAVARAKLTENKRSSTWRCPANTQGRYIRVQLERFNALSIAELEVFGYWGFTAGVGRCSHVSAGRDVTVAVVRPNTDPNDIDVSYQRAVYADAFNADILRQFETYALEYDKYGRGEVLMKNCMICRNIELCEACGFYQGFHKEILSMPPNLGAKRACVHEISDYLINSNKPPLPQIIVPKADRPSKWQIRSEAVFGKLGIGSWLWPKTKTYIRPEQAQATNPKELMKTLEYMKKVDFSKKPTADKKEESKQTDAVEAFVDEDDLDDHYDGDAVEDQPDADGGPDTAVIPLRQSMLPRSTSVTVDNFETQSVSPRGSIGSVYNGGRQPYQHGLGKNANKRIEVGDILPTGHRVKEAFPRSIAQQINDANRALAEKAAAQQAKEADRLQSKAKAQEKERARNARNR